MRVGLSLVPLLLCCREYNVGEGPEPFVQEVAQEEGLALPAHFQARQMVPETDSVAFDMVLVMDKFTAADVLREVSLLRMVPSRAISYSRYPCSVMYRRLCQL